MTVTPDFFRRRDVLRLLERAMAVTAVPASIHYCAGHEDELHILGRGGCAACRWVNALAEGAAACRVSRGKARALTRRQDVPVTFVCHLGFVCVSARALAENDYILTFGPYIPADAAEAIYDDVSRGLEAIGACAADMQEMPFDLDDLRRAPAGAVSAAVEWLVEGLRDLCDAADVPNDEPAHPTAPEPEAAFKAATCDPAVQPDVQMSMAALALLCGLIKHARATLAELLEEEVFSGNDRPEHLQAKLIQAVSAMLDAARNMGGDVERAWQRYPAFVSAVRGLDDPRHMLKKAMNVLSRVHPEKGGKRPLLPPYLPEVVSCIYDAYTDNLRLINIAEKVAMAPSSISRALEQRTGASFSEFLGRVRIAHGRRLLRNTRLSASDAGKRVGIADQSNFGKLFLRYSGCSPGVYRRRFRPKSPAYIKR